MEDLALLVQGSILGSRVRLPESLRTNPTYPHCLLEEPAKSLAIQPAILTTAYCQPPVWSSYSAYVRECDVWAAGGGGDYE